MLILAKDTIFCIFVSWEYHLGIEAPVRSRANALSACAHTWYSNNVKSREYVLMETMEHPLAKFAYCPVCGAREFVVNNEKSKRCERCGFVYFFNPSAATVAVIVNEKNELLAVRRAKEPAKGTLDLPGGFCDSYECAEEGVAREVLEETGLQVKDVKFLFSLPNVYPYSGFNVHTVDLFFMCTVDTMENAKAMDDAAELMWLPWHEIQAEDFGLDSIRMGVKTLLLKKNLNI